MRLLVVSYAYAPSIGGTETVSAILVHEFAAAGHEVVVVTWTPSPARDEGPQRIVRRPGPLTLLALVRWSDAVFHSNITLRAVWPLWICRRPWVVVHHTPIIFERDRPRLRDRLKLAVIRRGTNTCVSKALAATLPVPCEVISNPFDDRAYQVDAGQVRDRELVFLGRLVSSKGVDLLIQALGILARQGLHPRLTIIGGGPEEDHLKAMVAAEGVSDQVAFAGRVPQAELAPTLGRHRIMVVPSRDLESFGVVVLEGLACGLCAITSDHGGLPEALGACGLTFPNGDAAGLAACIRSLLDDPTAQQALLQAVPGHLAQHRPPVIAHRYLSILERVTGI